MCMAPVFRRCVVIVSRLMEQTFAVTASIRDGLGDGLGDDEKDRCD